MHTEMSKFMAVAPADDEAGYTPARLSRNEITSNPSHTEPKDFNRLIYLIQGNTTIKKLHASKIKKTHISLMFFVEDEFVDDGH